MGKVLVLSLGLTSLGDHSQSVKESYETTLLRRQKDRAEQSKMQEELEKKKRKEEEEEEARKKRKLATPRGAGAGVAKPGAVARKKRFMPKKRGRVGL